MKGLVLLGLTLVLAALFGFGIGRSVSGRHSGNHAPHARAGQFESTSNQAETAAGSLEAPAKPAPVEVTSEPIEAGGKSQPDHLSQFFDLILPLFADDAQALRKAVFPVTLRNGEAQQAVFDLIMSTEDASLLEDTGMFLMYAKDSKFVAQLAEAFSTDSNPARRRVLATALGQNIGFAEALPAVEFVLAGKDALLQAEALKWLSVDSISRKPEITDRIVPALQNLGLAGGTPEVRAAAIRALKGDASEAGISYLIQRILQDSHVETQIAALSSLPLNIMTIVPPMPSEQLSALWTVFGDNARDAGVRTHAAQMILNATSRKLGTLTDEQRQTLNAWVEARRKGESR